MQSMMYRNTLFKGADHCRITLNNILLKRNAGHSKWANIRHTKGAIDQQKSLLFSKFSRLMKLAIRGKTIQCLCELDLVFYNKCLTKSISWILLINFFFYYNTIQTIQGKSQKKIIHFVYRYIVYLYLNCILLTVYMRIIITYCSTYTKHEK